MTRYEYEQEPATRAQTDRIDRTVDGLINTVDHLLESHRALMRHVLWLYVILIVIFAFTLVAGIQGLLA